MKIIDEPEVKEALELIDMCYWFPQAQAVASTLRRAQADIDRLDAQLDSVTLTASDGPLKRISDLEAQVAWLRLALESWNESFERDIASHNFISEDGHEAMRLTAKALSAVSAEKKP